MLGGDQQRHRPAFAYVSNSVSGTISGYNINTDGTLSLLTADGHSAMHPDAHAALDSAVSSDGRFLYISTAGFSELSDLAGACNKMTISALRSALTAASIASPVSAPPTTIPAYLLGWRPAARASSRSV